MKFYQDLKIPLNNTYKSMYISFKQKLLLLVLLTVIMLPSFMMVQFRLPSLAIGALFSYFIIIILLYVVSKSKLFLSKKSLKIYVYVSIVVLVHGLIASTIFKAFDFSRFFGSYLIFSLMYFSILIFKYFSDSNYFDNLVFNKVLINIFKLLLFLGFIAFFLKYYPTVNYSQLNNGVFPFFEPSHYVISIAPFLFYFINSKSSKFKKLFYLLFFLSFLSVVNNLTLLLVIFLALFFFLRSPKQYLFSILFIGPLILFIVLFNFEYYSARMIQNDSENLSALVWMQGWENAWLMLKNTYGLGVGFQQFGINGLSGHATETIAYLRASEENSTLNQLDGGTLGAKIVGEFGILGIAIVFFLTRISILSIIRIKNDLSIMNNSIYLFSLCVISIYLIELFARSMSYISHTTFLFLFALTNYYDFRIKK